MPEIRTAFHKRLKEIQDDILAMGGMVEKAIILSMDALKERDIPAAHQIIADDIKINEKRFDIEDKCTQLIATQQPMASDLRIIISALSIISELERIGDHAEGTARIVILIGDEPPLKPLIDLPRMANKTADMLHRAVLSFVNRDAETARQIVNEDDEI
ncbi:MAG: phosphate signaling complex protein PhoU, partial [Dehalococcoidia bacterium]|nr:phosphate signaling complex protein PhoU [Dehalococcoidia bacterium]